MRAGRLRSKVTIERETGSGVDVYGGEVESWTPVAIRWGDLNPISGREEFDADQHRGEVSHRLWLRYGADIADLSSADRFTYGGRVFDIEVVKNINGRNRMLEVLAVERDT